MKVSFHLLAVFLLSITFTNVSSGQSNKVSYPVHLSDSQIQTQVDALAKIGNLGPELKDGFSRTAWSNAESAAMEYIRMQGEKMGLQARYDGIGNLFLQTQNGSNQIYFTGSHLDSVPLGGTFDGGAGVIAGLEAIRALIQAKAIPSDKDVGLVVWRGEESATFQAAYKGSKAAFGDKFEKDILSRTYEGKSLKELIIEQGFDPSFIQQNKATLTKNDVDSMASYVELHIEQANKMEKDGSDIGVVTSIRGAQRFKIEVTGNFDHSGATPMGVNYRRDANLTIAHIQVGLDNLLIEYLKKGASLVQTVGVVNSDKELNDKYPVIYENALTKVSGFGYFYLDMRGSNSVQLEEYVMKAKNLIEATANKFHTQVQIIALGSSKPIESMDNKIQQAIIKASKALDFNYQLMASGAGHDAAIVASHVNSQGKSIPVGMIFVPSQGGISHNRLEFTSTNELRKGAEVLANTLNLLLSKGN